MVVLPGCSPIVVRDEEQNGRTVATKLLSIVFGKTACFIDVQP